jgi:hypothetical protein
MARALSLLLVVGASGCASAGSPHLLPAAPSTAPLARPDAAVVVFARRDENTSTAAAVIDEKGRFLGDSAPGSRWAVAVPPGEHYFFAWDRFGEKSPDEAWYEAYHGANNYRVGRVGVLRAELDAGNVYYVEVATSGWTGSPRRWDRRWGVDLSPIALSGGMPPAWVQGLAAFDVARTSGQAQLDAEPDFVRHRITAGFDRFARLGDAARSMHSLRPGDGGCCRRTEGVLLARTP